MYYNALLDNFLTDFCFINGSVCFIYLLCGFIQETNRRRHIKNYIDTSSSWCGSEQLQSKGSVCTVT